MSSINTPKEDGKVRYRTARAAFVARGETLNAWCKANGRAIQNVREAFFGRWNGPGATEIVQAVERAAFREADDASSR